MKSQCSKLCSETARLRLLVSCGSNLGLNIFADVISMVDKSTDHGKIVVDLLSLLARYSYLREAFLTTVNYTVTFLRCLLGTLTETQ